MSQQGQFTGIFGDIQTLTGNVGGGVGPTGGNINIVGAGGVLVTGNPGTSTLTITGAAGVSSVDGGDNITVTTALGVATVDLDSSILQPNTTADGLSGVYALGVTDYTTDRFMHAYGTGNTFLGLHAGNLTLNTGSVAANTGIGAEVFVSLDVNAEVNTAVGALSQNALESGNENTSLGYGTLQNLVSGTFNLCLGAYSGDSYTTSESSNILLNHNGVIGESNTTRIGTPGVGPGNTFRTFIAGIYGVSPLAGSNQVVIMDMDGQLGTDTAGTYATMYVTDDLTATPAAGVLNIVGGDNINTEAPGSSNTVTVHLDTSISQPDTNASGTEGLYSLGGARFMHNYGTNNTFLGAGVANLTLTATDSVGIGTNCLAGVTSSPENCAIGVGSQFSLTSGNGGNISVGVESLLLLLTGAYNVALGHNSGNLLVGAESSNILINSLGVAAESNTLRIGASTGVGNQQLNAAYISGIYNKTVGAVAGLAMVDSTDLFGSINGTDGQIPIAATGGKPSFANITSSDASIDIVNGANTIDITVAGTSTGGVVYITTTVAGTPVYSADLFQMPADTGGVINIKWVGLGKMTDGPYSGNNTTSFGDETWQINRVAAGSATPAGMSLNRRASLSGGVNVNLGGVAAVVNTGSDTSYIRLSAVGPIGAYGNSTIYWKIEYNYFLYTNPAP